MKKLAFIILSGILAVSLTAGMSFAVDKLVVQDGVGNNVFTVDDLGQVTSTTGATVVAPDPQGASSRPHVAGYPGAGFSAGGLGALRHRCRGDPVDPNGAVGPIPNDGRA